MVPKQKGPRRRLIYRNHHPLLLSLLLTVFLNTGSAFIQLPIHAYAMSDTAYSGSGNSAKPLSAQLEGDNNNNESEASNDSAEETLLLPESSGDPSVPSIKLGESIRFEDMGPIIINSDGSTRQIDNWDKMTKSEQEVAWRRISKRNEQRRKALLEKQQDEQEKQNGKNE